MKITFIVLTFICCSWFPLVASNSLNLSERVPTAPSPRERLSFNENWTFARFGPMPDGTHKTEPKGIENPNFNSENWRQLNLPHDWGIEGPFRAELPNRTGKLPWAGIGWYKKTFALAASDASKHIYIDIDGAMSNSSVYINGHLAGGWPYGYASFRVDLTAHIKFGEQNHIAVRLDNPPESSRWYPGGGLYRNTWLVKTSPVHFPTGGVFVTTPIVSAEEATLDIKYEIQNASTLKGELNLMGQIYALGKGAQSQPVLIQNVPPMKKNLTEGSSLKLEQTTTLDSPKRWSVDEPELYCLVSTLTVNDHIVDVQKTVFGVRSIEFSAEKGFLLNGERVTLNGVCEHHDLGPLGAAFYLRGMERKFELLRDLGCNAIRTAHNMPAPELITLADKMGFLIINESFDCWETGKTPNDYGNQLYKDWHEKDLINFVRRDRNSPSVIMWCTGNEVKEQTKASGIKISRHLRDIIRSEDTTRPVTVGFSKVETGFNGIQKTVDAFGYNYKPQYYEKFIKENPTIPLYGSETASTISSRGEYFFPVSENKDEGAHNFQVSSYDFSAPPWANRPDIEFEAQDRNPSVAGEFVWTGFDYIGEPTPYNKDQTNLLNFSDEASKKKMLAMMEKLDGKVPSRSSYFGIFDLCGFPKDRYYLYQARWRTDLPIAHILPHWNWPERLGKVTPVHVYTTGDEAELFINGKSQGRQKRQPYQYRFRWDDVIYQPGECKVVTYKAGKVWAVDEHITTREVSTMTMSADRKELLADGYDLSYITVRLVDDKGQFVPRSNHPLQFDVQGAGAFVAAGNGNSASLESFPAQQRQAFNGMCLLIIKSIKGKTGDITVTVSSDGLKSSTLTLNASE